MESIAEAVPKDIDPYMTLNLTSTATAGEIKTAYKKLALRHHPDKAPALEKHTAHTTFQNIAFAYAILSSPHRRQLYDSTGSTSETLADADDDFDWLSFFRNQYSSISASALADFSTSYKLSAEERRDVLAAYTKHKGKMAKVYEEVMLSDPLEDEERFRTIIDEAIDREEIQAYDAFVKESKKSKDARMRKARREAGDAEKEARTNKKYQSIFGGDGKGGRDTTGPEPEDGDAHSGGAGAKKEEKTKADTNDLAAMIQSRQAARSDDFLDRLEAKYAGDAKTGRGKKRKAAQEPDEKAFERTKAKIAKAKAAEQDGEAKQNSNGRTRKGVRRPIRPVANGADAEKEEDDDEDINLEDGTDGDEEEDASASDIAAEGSEEEEQQVKSRRKAQKSKTSKKAPPPPPPAAKKKKKTPTVAATTKGRARGKK
ncbi:MAG: hypothetical protein Q9193_001187 [Seirophora villosa]